MAYPYNPAEGTTGDPRQIDENRRAKLQSILGLWRQFPGRAPGGTGPTGLLSTDASGWSQVLQDQIDAENLSGNPVTVQEAPYREDSRAARRQQLQAMDARVVPAPSGMLPTGGGFPSVPSQSPVQGAQVLGRTNPFTSRRAADGDAMTGLAAAAPIPKPGSQLLGPEDLLQPALTGTGSVPKDPDIVDTLYKRRLRDETRNRLFQAMRIGDLHGMPRTGLGDASIGWQSPIINQPPLTNEVAALKALLGFQEQDITESPGERARLEQILTEKANQEAMRLGFGVSGTPSPSAAAAAYARAVEAQKIGSPAAVARIGATGGLEQQKEQSRGALAVMESKGAQAQSFLDMMNQARMSGQNISGVTLPGGGGSVRYAQEQQVPPGLLNVITGARQKLEDAEKQANVFNRNTANIEAARNVWLTAVGNALSRDAAPDDVKQYVLAILRDPEGSKLPLTEIIRLKGETGITPDEQAMMQQLLTTYRGF